MSRLFVASFLALLGSSQALTMPMSQKTMAADKDASQGLLKESIASLARVDGGLHGWLNSTRWGPSDAEIAAASPREYAARVGGCCSGRNELGGREWCRGKTYDECLELAKSICNAWGECVSFELFPGKPNNPTMFDLSTSCTEEFNAHPNGGCGHDLYIKGEVQPSDADSSTESSARNSIELVKDNFAISRYPTSTLPEPQFVDGTIVMSRYNAIGHHASSTTTDYSRPFRVVLKLQWRSFSDHHIQMGFASTTPIPSQETAPYRLVLAPRPTSWSQYGGKLLPEGTADIPSSFYTLNVDRYLVTTYKDGTTTVGLYDETGKELWTATLTANINWDATLTQPTPLYINACEAVVYEVRSANDPNLDVVTTTDAPAPAPWVSSCENCQDNANVKVVSSRQAFIDALQENNVVIDLQVDVTTETHSRGGGGEHQGELVVPKDATVTIFSSKGQRTISGNKVHPCFFVKDRARVRLYDLTLYQCHSAGGGAGALWLQQHAKVEGTGLHFKGNTGNFPAVWAWYAEFSCYQCAITENRPDDWGCTILARGGKPRGILLNTTLIEDNTGDVFMGECGASCEFYNVHVADIGEIKSLSKMSCPGSSTAMDKSICKYASCAENCAEDPIRAKLKFLQPMTTSGQDQTSYSSCADIFAADETATSGTYTIVIGGQSKHVYCDMAADGPWTLVHVSNSDPNTAYNKYPVDGENYEELAENGDVWASLSETEMHDLWFSMGSTVMKVHSALHGAGYSGSLGSGRTQYIQRFDDSDFSPFRAIRYVPEWGSAGTAYGICEEKYAAGCYDAESNAVTHDGGTMHHWEDMALPVNGVDYTVSRHGIPGDHKSGCEWIYWFSNSGRDPAASSVKSASYCNGIPHSHGNGNVVTKIYLRGEALQTTQSSSKTPCPANSIGSDVNSGCQCNAGYMGTIVASDSEPFYTGSCAAVACPAESSGSDVANGCTCNAGHEGSVVASSTSPFYTGACTPVDCPANSIGTDVVSGCLCADGYKGTITASATSPYYTGSCTAVACPAGSTGTNVASGCTCNAGYVGEIIASDALPFYSGTCSAVPCPTNSHGENVAKGCTCDSGFVGTITAAEASPHFTGICSADCEGEWNDWTTCSQSCGSGTQSRTYSVTKDLVGNGEECSHAHGAEEGPHECNPKACPGEGFCESVAEWSEWGPCSHTCGDSGVQSRSRMVFPDDCEVDLMERACERHPCPVDCRLGEWSSWSVCSDECFSDGQQSRARIVEQEPAHGGLQCLPCNPLEETRRCGEQPSDCQLTEWTSWTTCSKTCSTGTQRRDRKVQKYEKCGGHECVCNMLETMNCFSKECEIDCEVDTWSPWSKCPVDCGGGTQSRTRAITVSNSGGGQECPTTIEFQNCGMASCLKHCTPSQWSEWSECSATCYGTAERTRHVVEHAASGGNSCDSLQEVKYCNHQCPFDCQVGAWNEWDTCSKSCGFGTMTRKRPITQRVENGGAACPHLTEAKTCSCAQCPSEL